MEHPPEVQWINLMTLFGARQIEVGWRGEDGKPKTAHHHLTAVQASMFSITAQAMVQDGRAGVCLGSNGWTIYPREEIPDVAALWLS